MRLCERTLAQAWLAKRIREEGELGGVAERFSDEKIPMRASLLPEEGTLAARERGAVRGEKLRLLVSSGIDAAAGDGVWVEDGLWRILSVQRWTAHAELVCERI